MAESATLVDILDRSLRRFDSNPLFGTKVRGRYEWTTYGEFGRQVDKARTALVNIGFREGERLAIISSNRVEWAVVAYAAYQLGGVVVPMYEAQSPEDWSYIMQDAEPSVLAVSDAKVFSRMMPVFPDVPSIRYVIQFEGAGPETASYAQWMEGESRTERAEVKPEQLAGLIYTSGTTGRPKGVMLTHQNLASNIGAVEKLFPIGPGDVSLSFLPWAHAFGQVVELHGLLSVGAAMGIVERVETLLTNLSEVRPTMLVSVPRIFNRIYASLREKIEDEGGLKKKLFYAGIQNTARLREKEEAHKDGPLIHISNRFFDELVFSKVKARFGGRMKYAFSGGAALSPEVAKFIDHLNIMVYEGYGLSETSPIISANYPGHRKLGSVGKPIPGVRIEIDESQGTQPGEGEIICHGPNVMKGYFHLPKETEDTLMPDGGLRTGDIGYLDEDGYLYVTGRVKDLYKLENGKYVVPTPLEDELQLSPLISQAMLYGDNLPYNIALIVPDHEGLKKVVRDEGLPQGTLAELVARPKVQSLLEDEVSRISRNWKGYERPRKTIAVAEEWTVENGLLTPTLKAKRSKVAEKYKEKLTPRSPAHHKEDDKGGDVDRPSASYQDRRP